VSVPLLNWIESFKSESMLPPFHQWRISLLWNIKSAIYIWCILIIDKYNAMHHNIPQCRESVYTCSALCACYLVISLKAKAGPHWLPSQPIRFLQHERPITWLSGPTNERRCKGDIWLAYKMLSGGRGGGILNYLFKILVFKFYFIICIQTVY